MKLQPLKRNDPENELATLPDYADFFKGKSRRFLGTMPAGIIPAELDRHPTFWNEHEDLKPLDRFELVSEDRAWYAEFLVVSCKAGRVVVTLRSATKLG